MNEIGRWKEESLPDLVSPQNVFKAYTLFQPESQIYQFWSCRGVIVHILYGIHISPILNLCVVLECAWLFSLLVFGSGYIPGYV